MVVHLLVVHDGLTDHEHLAPLRNAVVVLIELDVALGAQEALHLAVGLVEEPRRLRVSPLDGLHVPAVLGRNLFQVVPVGLQILPGAVELLRDEGQLLAIP
jgi:hypothetical protein